MIYLICHIYITQKVSKGETLINKVKAFRQAKGLSQLALAQAIGVARQTINLIENDKYNPSLDLCIKLAQTLDTDLNSLFWHPSKPKQD